MGGEQREVAGWVVGLVRSLRWVLWVLLFAAVVATLEGLPALRDVARGGRFATGLSLVPVVLVGLFIVGYAVYRFTLVRAGRYPAGKAMTQIALMSVFFAMILRWGGAPDVGARADQPVDLAQALASQDPEVRALAAEVLRARPRGEALNQAERLIALLSDPSGEVRRQAHESLVQLAGRDLGAGSDSAGAWRTALLAAPH